MHSVAFDAVVGVFQAGVGVVDGANTHLMPASETQACAQPIFELEGGAELFPFDLGAFERGDTNTSLDIGLDRITGEFVNEYGCQRYAVVSGGFIALPVGVTSIPIAGQPTDAGLEPAAVEIKLHTEPVRHGRLACLSNCSCHVWCLNGRYLSKRDRRSHSKRDQLFHGNFLSRMSLIFLLEQSLYFRKATEAGSS